MSSFRKLVAIVGLPRSGTTLAGAIFDAHPDIVTCFEPWNSNAKERVTADITITELMRKYGIRKPWGANVFAVKETSITDAALEWLDAFMENHRASMDVQLVWTVRNYSHTYLSLIDGARKYWGHQDLEVNPESYNQWVNRASVATGKIAALYRKYHGVAYSYDAMVADPGELLPRLMAAIDIPFHSRQLDYFRHIEKEGIRGDVGLSTEPGPISTDSGIARQREWAEVGKALATAESDALRRKLDTFAERIFEQRIVTGELEQWLPA